MANKEEGAVEAEIIEETVEIRKKKGGKGVNSRVFWGLILIFVGIMFLLQNYFEIDVWDSFWPILLVFIGLFLIVKSSWK